MTVVLDASALLAFAHDEPGAASVDAVLAEAVISAVNWSEVLQKSIHQGIETRGLRQDFEAMGLRLEPFTVEDAECAAALWSGARSAGLSLGDRACLALGLRFGAPVLTADRAWISVAPSLGIDVRCVR